MPGAAGRQIQGYTIELALRDKTFGSYIDDVAGTDFNGSTLLSRVSGTGNPTLSMLSLNAVAIPASGYLGQIDLSVSRALTSADGLAVQSASIAVSGGVQSFGYQMTEGLGCTLWVPLHPVDPAAPRGGMAYSTPSRRPCAEPGRRWQPALYPRRM